MFGSASGADCRFYVQKSKKTRTASEPNLLDNQAAPVVVPAIMVSSDIVVIPAASMDVAVNSEAGGTCAAQPDTERTVGNTALKGPTGARAFKRVNDEEWLGKKGAWDNSYEAKFGNSGYGAKASQTLLQVHSFDASGSVYPAV